MTAPVVDVVLPTFRAGPWVHEAIASVLAQTHRSLRLYVIDDASPDASADAIAQRWDRADPRIELVRRAERGGAAAARNEAVRRGTGAWLAFIDQDDRWRPGRLERQLALAQARPGLAVVHCDLVHLDAAGRERRGEADADNRRRAAIDWEGLDASALARACFRRISIRLGAALVRRAAFESLRGFDAHFFGGEEWEFWVRLAAAGGRVAHLPEPLVERRIHAGNTSSVAVSLRREGHFAAIDAVVARHPELEELAPPLRAAILRSELLCHLREGHGAAAREAARRLRAVAGSSPELHALWLASLAAPLLSPLLPWLERAAQVIRRAEIQ